MNGNRPARTSNTPKQKARPTRGAQSPFDGSLPHGTADALRAQSQARLQPPVRRPQRSRKPRPPRPPPPAERVIDLDRTRPAIPSLDPTFWTQDSPFIVRASHLQDIGCLLPLVTPRPIWCRGAAELVGILHLDYAERTLLAEQPFQLHLEGTHGTINLLAASPNWRDQGLTTPWESVTAWLIQSTTLLEPTKYGARLQARLREQVGRGLALAHQTGCTFAVLFVEVPGRPRAPDPASWATDLGCRVEMVSLIRGRNLGYMKPRQILLSGRDDALFDSLLTWAHRTAVPLLIPDLADRFDRPAGQIRDLLLHAAQHGVLAWDLERPFDWRQTLFTLQADWHSSLEALRSR